MLGEHCKTKNMRIVFIGIGVLLAAAAAAAVIMSNQTSSFFAVENNDDGSISVAAQKAAEEAGGMGYITISEGQELYVRSNLTDNSTVRIEVLPRQTDATTKVLLEESFTGIDVRYFELPEGEYIVRITAKKGAEGTMDITSKEGS